MVNTFLDGPKNAEGKAPRPSRTSVGTPMPRGTINQSIPPAQGYFDPVIRVSGNTAGDTVYFLLTNVFDPRTLMTDAGVSRYTIASGQPYRDIWFDIMYQVLFAGYRMRQEPAAATINEMMEIIVDTSRMLGIYLTALTMSASRDPDMFARSRALGLFDSKIEMQTVLAGLVLPRQIVELNLKYIRLMDTANDFNYQNVGFLTIGDYDAFQALHSSVRSKGLALNFLRGLYPEIGLLGDPNAGYIPDVLQAFINANLKTIQSTDAYAPYVLVDGASDEVKKINSGGILHSVTKSNTAHTLTGWGIPGSGVGNIPALRSYVPAMCVWKAEPSKDAAITANAGSPQIYAVNTTTNVVTLETVNDVALANNIVHEYNMNCANAAAMVNPLTFNGTSGAITSAALAGSDTRYRVSAGFGLGALTFDLQANVTSAIRDILLSQ